MARTARQAEESRSGADNISPRYKQVSTRELTAHAVAKKLPNYTRIRASDAGERRVKSRDSRRQWPRSVGLRNYDHYPVDATTSNTAGESVIPREEIVNFLLALISEANHLELLRRPTNHFQPSVPDRRQFQYISRDYKHSEGLINFALSHRPYP